MLQDLKKQLGEAYAQEKTKQANMAKQPQSPATRAHNRKGGLLLVGLGCVAMVINVLSYLIVGRTLIFMLAAMLGLWAIGIWLLVFGRSLK